METNRIIESQTHLGWKKPLRSNPALKLNFRILIQVQDFAHGPDELHEVHTGPSQACHISLGDTSLQHVQHTTHHVQKSR